MHDDYRGKISRRIYELDINYFDKWSKNMSYILGFIYADGYIREDSNKLRFNLKRQDRVLLESIKEELKFTGNIIDYDSKINNKLYESSRLVIGSYDMIKRLVEIGLYSNKSLTVTLPNIPKEFEIDFIRGYFDGNGSIEVKKQSHNIKNSVTYQLRLRIMGGSESMIKGIHDILVNYGLKPKNIPKSKGKEVYTITYSTSESYKIYDLFYKDAELYLDRKKSKFEEGFKLRELDKENKLKQLEKVEN